LPDSCAHGSGIQLTSQELAQTAQNGTPDLSVSGIRSFSIWSGPGP